MNNDTSSRGSCLCGQVKITANTINPKFTACHCDTCRQWGGGPFFAVQCGTEVEFEGGENIQEYQSSAWASRAFCKNCGTHLYYRLLKANAYNMPVGIFSNIQGLVMDMQYFIDKRPDYYCFANQTKEMTEAEILSYFATQM